MAPEFLPSLFHLSVQALGGPEAPEVIRPSRRAKRTTPRARGREGVIPRLIRPNQAQLAERAPQAPLANRLHLAGGALGGKVTRRLRKKTGARDCCTNTCT